MLEEKLTEERIFKINITEQDKFEIANTIKKIDDMTNLASKAIHEIIDDLEQSEDKTSIEYKTINLLRNYIKGRLDADIVAENISFKHLKSIEHHTQYQKKTLKSLGFIAGATAIIVATINPIVALMPIVSAGYVAWEYSKAENRTSYIRESSDLKIPWINGLIKSTGRIVQYISKLDGKDYSKTFKQRQEVIPYIALDNLEK